MNNQIKTTFRFHGDLPTLLRGKWKKVNSVSLNLNRRTTVKDAIESFGVPHTEIGAIVLNGKDVDFSIIVEEGTVTDVYPVPIPWSVTEPSTLRPVPLPSVSFVVDVNVGRLARYLRAAGFDTLYDPKWNDEFLAEMMQKEKRILLTRDLHLLKRKQVLYGRYVRETVPQKQLHEIVTLFGLGNQIALFTRCLECNNLLQQINKQDVLHRLEPLTKKYYSKFSICPLCKKIFWPGSHVERMKMLFVKKEI